MNGSTANVTVVIQYRDSFVKAVTKNMIVVALGISINYINASLIHTFCKHQIFYTNPRYILFIHLVINDMVQLTLSIILFLISYIFYTINVSVCCVFLVFVIFTNENNPLNLACMAVECYIAICFPLRHTQICTVKRTFILIGLIWTTNMFSLLPDLFITLAKEPLGFFHSRVFCLRETVFRNSYVSEKKDVSYIVLMVGVWLVLFYTYLRILLAAQAATADAKKARNTVLLHGFQLFLCMLTYVCHFIINGLTYLLPTRVLAIRYVIYVLIQILPRLISPVVYGLRDKTFRKYMKKHWICRMNTGGLARKTLKRKL
ncbi:hypothetical protein LDENG_00036780 [Lucifuga dentata]|nr:hypothetical protein LDENG_00036780 [Lucifuga dentata]